MAGPRKQLLGATTVVAVAWSGLAFGQSQDQSSPPASQSAAAPQVPTRVRVSSGVMGGLLIKKASPEYSKKARQEHIPGVV